MREQFKAAVAGVNEQIFLDGIVKFRSVEEGAGRLDALNRIGNQVFALDMRDSKGLPNFANYAPTNAPVHFPHIWGTPWFSWAQYNSSIQQPMVRNAGEAMGVAARVNLSDQGKPLYDSAVNFAALHQIESDLSGPYAEGHTPLTDKHFTGLAAPKWPDLLPKIDQDLAARGGALYAQICAGCHLPAVNTQGFWDAKFWKGRRPQPERSCVPRPAADLDCGGRNRTGAGGRPCGAGSCRVSRSLASGLQDLGVRWATSSRRWLNAGTMDKARP